MMMRIMKRRTPPLKVKDEEDGKVTRLKVRDIVEDDDLSLHSFDESDFLCDNGNDASAEDSPGPSKEPLRKGASLKDPRLCPEEGVTPDGGGPFCPALQAAAGQEDTVDQHQ
ncbi:hypothetical protein J4Q44_G00390000 [Coregonus suidteri]|uniref:Uncharacterized protein n=1 Tax=Coregonus suidteri TaxID=861788 RepID=A0AAN8QIN4_9TELE